MIQSWVSSLTLNRDPIILIAEIFPELLFAGWLLALLIVTAIAVGRGQLPKANPYKQGDIDYTYGFFMVALFYLGQLFILNARPVAEGYLLVSEYVSLLKFVVLASALFIFFHSRRYLLDRTSMSYEYPLIYFLCTLFLLLLVGSTHLLSMFFAIIGFSLNLYVLILFDTDAAGAREAGVKYYYLSTFSTGLMLYGIFLLFALTGSGQFSEIAQYLATLDRTNPAAPLAGIAIVLLLSGFFFKLSAFPGHLWAPEVYDGSAAPTVAFFTLPVKTAVLASLLQLVTSALAPASALWQPVLAFAALGSLLWGCFGALYERNTKRFLAYASINQMGFLLTGLATGLPEGYRATILYLLIYVVMTGGFLVLFLKWKRRTHPTRDCAHGLPYLSDFRPSARPERSAEDRWYGRVLAYILLSMAGIPPLAGFFGKYYLLLHALEQGLYSLVIVGLVTSLISAYYYLRIIKTALFESGHPSTLAPTLLSPRPGESGKGDMRALRLITSALWGFVLMSPPLLSLLSICTYTLLYPAV